VQPISYASSSFFNPNTIPLASFLPLAGCPTGSKATAAAAAGGGGGGGGGDGEDESALDIEFENEWETTSDWNEDDVEVVTEESELCFPGEGEGPMDLS
jgi:CTD kinase subunit gamma